MIAKPSAVSNETRRPEMAASVIQEIFKCIFNVWYQTFSQLKIWPYNSQSDIIQSSSVINLSYNGCKIKESNLQISKASPFIYMPAADSMGG